MILKPRSNILVCHRRLYHDDPLRFFVGTVTVFGEDLAKGTRSS